jgi:ribosomal protein S18 acetylase RimI-like enzyme
MYISIMSIEDYEEAYQLWGNTKGMALHSFDDSEIGIKKLLDRNPSTNFVCRIEGKLVGVILCGHDGRRGYIYHAAVDKNNRKNGIGKLLVEIAVEALDNEGIKKVVSPVFLDNKTGNEFWEAVGFANRKDVVYRDRVIDESNKWK